MIPHFTVSLFSFKLELTLISGIFFTVMLLPILAVLLLTQTGSDVVSDTLVSVDEQTGTVQILNPKDGSVYKELTATFAWPKVEPITLEFGGSSLYQAVHTGIDIGGKTGDPIAVFLSGTVIYAGEIAWGYGRHVIVDHGDNLTSIYAHLSTIQVKKGDKVEPGKVIGTMGSTGWSTGSHLHFQINVFGILVNPRRFLKTNKDSV